MSDLENPTGAASSAPHLLKRREAAKRLAISERKLDELAASGEIRRVKIGTAVRFEPQDLQAYIESKKVG